MRFIDLVVGLGETESRRIARECLEHPRVDELLDRRRQRRARVEGVRRLAEDVLGHEVVAASDADVDRRRVVHRVHRDIAPTVAAAHHEDPLPRQLLRILVAAGVDQLAAELAVEPRDIGLREGAVGDHQGRELPDLHLVTAGGVVVVTNVPHGEPPPRVACRAQRFRTHDLGAEAEAVAEAEVFGEVAEVSEQAAVVRVVGGIRGHGELGELRGAGRRDEVRRVVDGAARRVDVPQPADVVREVKAHPRHPLAVEVARRGQA